MKKILYVGLDVHKETIYLCALLEKQTTPIAEQEMPFNLAMLLKRLKKWQSDYEVRTCYEAGCFGYSIYRALQEAHVHCLIAAPNRIPSINNPRVKTDRHDARNLANMLHANLLTQVHVPTMDEESLRDLLRARQDVHKERARLRQRLTSFLLRHQSRFEEGKPWTLKFDRWLVELKMGSEYLDCTLKFYAGTLRCLDEQMDAIDRRIKETADSPMFKETVTRLMAFKGIGPLTALSMICEVGDFKRFSTAPAFMSSLGLVPSVHQSGNTAYRGSITKVGNAHLRTMLIEGCWSYRYASKPNSTLEAKRRSLNPIELAYVIKATKHLEEKWRHLVYRKGKPVNVATTAVARELSGFIWGLMNNKIA